MSPRFGAHRQKCLFSINAVPASPVSGEGAPRTCSDPPLTPPSLCPQGWASASEMSPWCVHPSPFPNPSSLQSVLRTSGLPRDHLWCHGAPWQRCQAQPRPWLQTPTPHDPGRRALSFWAAEAPSAPCAGMLQASTPELPETPGLDVGPWTELAQKQVPPLVRDGPVIQKCSKRPFTVPKTEENCAEQTIRHQSTFFTLLYTERNYKAIVLFKNMSIFVDNLLLCCH